MKQRKPPTSRKPLTDKNGEVRELAKADFDKAVPFEALPGSLQHKLQAITTRGRPKSDAPKEMIAFRFSPSVVSAIKATGKGYNVRVEHLLREAIEKGLL